MAACFRCGVGVDPLRSPARIVDTYVVSLCRPCAALPRNVAEAPVAAVTLPPAEPAAIPAPLPRSRRRVAAVAVATALGALVYVLATRNPGSAVQASAVAPAALPVPADDSLAVAPAAARVTPKEPPLVPKPSPPPIPAGAFVHPLPAPVRYLPETDDRRFGAARSGGKQLCGDGHCGVDIGDVEGMPVLAVRDGEVDTVVRRADDRGGRWVRLRHAGGMSTYYMHLGEIRSDLRPGSRVVAGEPFATLGHTGIRRSAPHLHFAVTVAGDSGEVYVDPVPLLLRAALVDPAPTYSDPGAGVAATPDPALPAAGHTALP